MRLLALSFFLLAGCPQQRLDLVGGDEDGDGFHSGIDCDDADSGVSPGATEVTYNGVDDDCDADTPDDDVDGDGFAEAEDCDDADARRFPGATEVCNDVDDDCDESTDDGLLSAWHADDDGDGFGDPDTVAQRCDGDGVFVRNAFDCDDTDVAVHPGADEECNGIDDDCDDDVDTDAVSLLIWYADADDDLFGDPTETLVGCTQPLGYVANPDDCDDTVGTGASAHPGADEVCNLRDDDCDGGVDVDASNAVTFYFDHDGDDFGTVDRTTQACANPDPDVWTANDDDCYDFLATARPGGIEVCNGIDDDCDGTPDDAATNRVTFYRDLDQDGFGDLLVSELRCDDGGGDWVLDALDCDDSETTGPSAYPGADEVCDGADNDCNGVDDDVPTAPLWYEDFDDDGFGDPFYPLPACDDPSGGTAYVENADDCDDLDDAVHPGVTETCDDVDQDCDGLVDDGAAPLITWYVDGDGDTYGDDARFVQGCSAPADGFVAEAGDCDDTDDAINPDEAQACSTVDTNCDELVPTATGCTWGTTCLDVLQEFPEWAGTDRTFLLDPESNGSPVQYLCDMTPTGGRPGAGWTRILSQNFTDGQAGGWQWDPVGSSPTAAAVNTCSGGSYGNILGVPSASSTAGGFLFQTFSGLPHDEIWVTFDYLRIDTWDSGELAYVSAVVEPDDYSSVLWFGNPGAGGEAGCGDAGDLDARVTVTEHGATFGHDPLEVRIGSTLGSAPADETFGFDNLELWIR